MLPLVPVVLLKPEDKPPEKDFVEKWNLYAAEVWKSHTQGQVSVTEMRLWREVKDAWGPLKRKLDQYYG